jgi:hypothetical protein
LKRNVNDFWKRRLNYFKKNSHFNFEDFEISVESADIKNPAIKQGSLFLNLTPFELNFLAEDLKEHHINNAETRK